MAGCGCGCGWRSQFPQCESARAVVRKKERGGGRGGGVPRGQEGRRARRLAPATSRQVGGVQPEHCCSSSALCAAKCGAGALGAATAHGRACVLCMLCVTCRPAWPRHESYIAHLMSFVSPGLITSRIWTFSVVPSSSWIWRVRGRSKRFARGGGLGTRAGEREGGHGEWMGRTGPGAREGRGRGPAGSGVRGEPGENVAAGRLPAAQRVMQEARGGAAVRGRWRPSIGCTRWCSSRGQSHRRL